jgi:Domain of unknown function (DUF4397)
MRKLNFTCGFILLIELMLSGSCKKTTEVIDVTAAPDSSYLSITNASPAISDLLLYVGNQQIPLPHPPLSYGYTTYSIFVHNNNAINPSSDTIPYVRIPSGYQQVSFTTPTANHYLVSFSNYFAPGTFYSVFVTDTVTHGHVPYVLTQDNFRPSDTGAAQFRFLNLSPDAPPMDIWAFPYAGPNGFEVSSNNPYLPNNDGVLLSVDTFSTIKPAPYYFVATQAGTYNVLLNGGLFVPAKSITTLYSLGYVSGTGPDILNVGVIQYNH